MNSSGFVFTLFNDPWSPFLQPFQDLLFSIVTAVLHYI